jgi:hypothetical protein
MRPSKFSLIALRSLVSSSSVKKRIRSLFSRNRLTSRAGLLEHFPFSTPSRNDNEMNALYLFAVAGIHPCSRCALVIHVKGEPDAVFKLKGGKTAIIDYKTARYTKGQDRLLPIYNVQLNVYNYLRVASGQAAADKLFLIYMEPVTSREDGEYQE